MAFFQTTRVATKGKVSMPNQYHVECDCSAVKFILTGDPIVHDYCHCEDCRELLKLSYHAVTVWEKDSLEIATGEEFITEFQHPTEGMKRMFCSRCGETLFNSNNMEWRVVSQLIIRKCYNNGLPEMPSSNNHFFFTDYLPLSHIIRHLKNLNHPKNLADLML